MTRTTSAYAGSPVGWIPYQLERADAVWQQHGEHRARNGQLPEPPAFCYYRQVYGCFFGDFYGVDDIDEVAVDKVTLEVDYPHTASTWPDTESLARSRFGGLTEQGQQVARRDAIRMLHLDKDC
jgi:hypothetical protein